jgi:YegS/Rv2252/BmrU family lipid kinase
VTTVMIVNPASDSGRTAKAWPRIAQAAKARGIEFEVRTTQRAGHATELTREALRQGATLIIAIGGDGTVSEVANGFFDGGEQVAPAAELAVICRGSGCDFVRTFGISTRTDRALDVITSGESRTIDVGVARFTGPDGEPAERLFVNVASAGMTGYAAEKASASSKRLGATLTYAWAGFTTLMSYTNPRMRVSIDGEERELVSNNVIVANCQSWAGGMKILPMAEPDDGELDVLVWGDISKGDLIRTLPRLYRGTHTTHPKATITRAREVTVTPEQPLPIELDGELPGTTPATFTLRPAALRLRVPG